MSDNEPQAAAQAKEILPTRPRVFFSSITFKDGTEINLGNNDIVVFVGGNNAGKSQSLKDLESLLTGEGLGKSIIKANIATIGSGSDLLKFIQTNSFYEKREQMGNIIDHYENYGFRLDFFQGTFDRSISQQWSNKQIGALKGLFCRRIGTETRITDSNQTNSFPARSQPPSNAIQFLFKESHEEKRVSNYFKEAFGQELIIDRGALSEIPILVGKSILPMPGELLTDDAYGKRLYQNAMPLQQQGDGMRSFASIILQALAYKILSIILLDEPEAFLHPPQAKILGRILAKERPRDAQLFIATHSIDILMGLLEAEPDNLRIIRLNREGQKQAVELNKDNIRQIMGSPLLRYSNVLSGAFYKRAILCEDSSDCLFYQAMLEAMGKPVSDALFLQTGGKDQLPQLAKILTALEVPMAIIADIDILQDGSKGTFKGIIDALGGDWEAIEKFWRPLKEDIEQNSRSKSGKTIKEELQTELTNIPDEQAEIVLEKIKDSIEESLTKLSPWKSLKNAGYTALPAGKATERWNNLQKLCAATGLWIVLVGEIEGFCKTIGDHGPKWVQQVLETRNLSEDRELQPARKFISAVWDNAVDGLN